MKRFGILFLVLGLQTASLHADVGIDPFPADPAPAAPTADFQTVYGYFRSLLDQNGNKWLYEGRAAVEKTQQFMQSGADFEQFKKANDYFRSLRDQNGNDYVCFGRIAVDKAMTLTSNHVDLLVFHQAYEHFRSLLDQNGNQYLFFGPDAVEISIAAKLDTMFELETFKKTHEQLRWLTPQNGNGYLYFGRSAVQQSFSFMGMTVNVEAVLNAKKQPAPVVNPAPAPWVPWQRGYVLKWAKISRGL